MDIGRYANLGWQNATQIAGNLAHGFSEANNGVILFPSSSYPPNALADKAMDAGYFVGGLETPGKLLAAGATGVGVIGINHVLGNPLGHLVDTLDFGLTNFAGDNRTPVVSQPQITIQQPGVNQNPSTQTSIPQLDAEQLARQAKRLQENTAVNLITLQALNNVNQNLSY